ncbi:hypothetical protein PGT21_025187 [Puccinia graminis f. sp. tritici]|uniref:Uncharacterized protein n=1 Tax=Puccinia graminis f. sp. tritici TaxID=56615 RepID=A0A5B0RYE5_PUCGR|nr:hypothetical protein PGT21_025187 [Puccinia graminis f. sp. tritici]KAA1131046.1 hypothetical protein PGTUg99_029199 [Puccinia graminis f. sp. tritici]
MPEEQQYFSPRGTKTEIHSNQLPGFDEERWPVAGNSFWVVKFLLRHLCSRGMLGSGACYLETFSSATETIATGCFGLAG